jgi:arylsulfatase A-like enzyme
MIPKKFPTMGRLMKSAGYYTIGVTGNGFIGNWGGYSRGFDEFRNMMQEKHVVNGDLPGAQIVEEVIRRLGNHVHDDQPVFVFMGTVDSHSPWIGRPPWMERYDPGPYDGPFQERGLSGPLGLIKGKMGCHKVPKDRDIQRLRAIYDSTISYQDALIGDLRAALDKLGIADQTMIVITADHGEEMFEERRCGHGKSLRDSLARVPLVVNYPGRIAARTVDEGSEGIDILPTILDAIGAPAPDHLQGRSLRGLAAGDGEGWTEPSFASQYEYAFAMRLGRWKAWVDRHATPLVRDMVGDPDERIDLAGQRPIERRYLTDHLGLYLEYREEWQKATWGVVSNMTEYAAEQLDGGAA